MQNNIKKLDEIFTSEPDQLRIVKASRTLRILAGHQVVPEQSTCLEIGTGSGVMSNFFSKRFAEFISIDKYDLRKDNNFSFNFSLMDSEKLEFPDNHFDVIIFSHVYQYLENKQKTLQEIHRVLKDSGICYFSTSNKFSIIEPHYHLPFLGYFPRMLASSYLRIFSRGYTEYDIYSENYISINRSLAREFHVQDITIDLIKNYQQYDFSEIPIMKIAAKIPSILLKLLRCTIMTNWIFILRKRN